MKKQKFWMSLCGGALAASMVLPLLGTPMRARALESDELQNQIADLQDQNQQIQDQIAELEQQRVENNEEIQQVVDQKNNIDKQINLLNEQVANINKQIASFTKLIADKQVELDAAQTRFDQLSVQNKERIRAMEEDGTISYWSVLFKANSFSDFLDRLNMVQEIAASDQRRLEEMSQAARRLSDARESLLAEKEGLEQSKADLAESEKELAAGREASEALLSQLVARGEEYQALIAEKDKDVDDLMNRIAQKEVERTEALQREWEAAHPPETEPPATEPPEADDPWEEDPSEDDPSEDDPWEEDPDESDGEDDYVPPSSDGWNMPCSYVYVSSPFSEGRMHPILGYVRPHNGIDLAAYLGTPVYATRSGYVTEASWDDGGGNYVYINHGDGFSSGYLHMDSYIVESGQYVEAGEVIGYVGTTGLSEGPHLHFAIAYMGSYVNPADYIAF